MDEQYRKLVTISGPIGSLGTLATLDGWSKHGDERGVFVVTDPDWRDDVAGLLGCAIVPLQDAPADDKRPV